MPPIVLVIIFVIHAVVFFGLYLRKKRLYQLILTFGFLFLISFYLTKTLGIEKSGLGYLRWAGIIIATIGTVFLITAKIQDRKTRLRPSGDYGGQEGGTMKSSKMPMYIFVTLLSLVLTYACYGMLAKRKPDMAVKGDMRVVYNHYKEEDAGYAYKFFISASSRSTQIPADGAKVYWLKDSDFKAKYPNIQKSDFKMEVMSPIEKGGFFAHQLPTMEKNHKTYFFIEITDSQNNVITMPEKFLATKVPYHVSFKQDPNNLGLVIHILLMIFALFFLLHGFYYAFNYIWNKTEWNIHKALSSLWWGLLCYGISAFPLGIWIEYEKYGTYWTGFPLGWDMTDSKTLFNFAYWFVILMLMKGSLFSKDPQKNLVSYKTFAWLTILGGVLTMVVRFAIPHGDL